MATKTYVITYTAASGEVMDVVTSFTSGGVAYDSITAANAALDERLLSDAAKLITSAASSIGSALTTKTNDVLASGFRGTNT